MGSKPIVRTGFFEVPQHKIDGRMPQRAALARGTGSHPAGSAIHMSHMPAAIDVDAPPASARMPDHRGHPGTAHAAVIHGEAPSFAHDVNGGRHREAAKPEGMELSEYKTSTHPGTNFYNLSLTPALINEVNFSVTHTVEAVIEGIKDEGAAKFKVWNLTMERGGKKYVLKVLLPLNEDEENEFVVIKGSAEGFKAKNQLSRNSGNLHIQEQPEHPTTDISQRKAKLLINAFVTWDDNADSGTQFPPIVAQIDGNTLTFRFITKAEFDTRVQAQNFDLDAPQSPVVTPAAPTATATAVTSTAAAAAPAQLEFAGSALMRSAMEMAGAAPALIDDALTNAYLLDRLFAMGVIELDDRMTVIEALDLKANIGDLGSLQETLKTYDEHTLQFLEEAKGLGNVKLYSALRLMDNAGFNFAAVRADIVRLFDLVNDPTKAEAALATLNSFDKPRDLNFTNLRYAKALGDIALYPLVNIVVNCVGGNLNAIRSFIAEFDLSLADLQTEDQPKLTEARAYSKGFGGRVYRASLVQEAKTWVLDETINGPDIVGLLLNFLREEDRAVLSRINEAFLVAFSNAEHEARNAIVAFGKAYDRATPNQRETAMELIDGYIEGEKFKGRFARLLNLQIP